MPQFEIPGSPSLEDFRIGEWSAHPRLNRIVRGDESAQLEPKMMEVLSFLSMNPGEVRSKREILDAVWPDVIVTEAVLTRAVAGLRRVLGDDAKSPSYIETIARRGYRLIAPVVRTEVPRAARAVAPPRMDDEDTVAVPYVVGQWVRGSRFYGRRREISEVIHGDRRSSWLLGTRRVGKTSFLRQIEFVTAADPSLGLVPLFWDLQGCVDPEELHLGFVDALLDAEDRFVSLGLSFDLDSATDLFETLRRLRKLVRKRSAKLLLLCDEAEELISLQSTAPAMLPKLRRALLSHEDVRTVLTSGSRLWSLAEQPIHTSPFLDGFMPPIYLAGLDPEEALGLIRQTQLPGEAQPVLDEPATHEILRLCGHHPYLMQLLGKRMLEIGELERAIEVVAEDRTVSSLFEVDLGLLTPAEREILRTVALDGRSDAKTADVQNLTGLGLLTHDDRGELAIANDLLLRWLRRDS